MQVLEIEFRPRTDRERRPLPEKRLEQGELERIVPDGATATRKRVVDDEVGVATELACTSVAGNGSGSDCVGVDHVAARRELVAALGAGGEEIVDQAGAGGAWGVADLTIRPKLWKGAKGAGIRIVVGDFSGVDGADGGDCRGLVRRHLGANEAGDCDGGDDEDNGHHNEQFDKGKASLA